MAAVALDTDVASLIIKNRLPAGLAAQLVGAQTAITFVTLGELTNWVCCTDR
jgi:toxin FitB